MGEDFFKAFYANYAAPALPDAGFLPIDKGTKAQDFSVKKGR
jgi:hypothetical protein